MTQDSQWVSLHFNLNFGILWDAVPSDKYKYHSNDISYMLYDQYIRKVKIFITEIFDFGNPTPDWEPYNIPYIYTSLYISRVDVFHRISNVHIYQIAYMVTLDMFYPRIYSISLKSRLYTTIENPSYFFMTLSCTEAIQSFISHFNQYSLVDPSWGNISSWVWQGVSHWFRKLRRRVWHHCHFGNWISWK